MEYNTDHFLSMLAKMNISLSDKQLQQFMTYYEMLIEKNKVMNLTAITDFDEVVEVVERDFIAFENVGAVFGLAQQVAGAAVDDLAAVLDVAFEHFADVHELGLALVERKQYHAERRFELRVLEELVENHPRRFPAFELHHDPRVFVGLVAYVADFGENLVRHELGDVLHERVSVDVVGDFRDDDLFLAVFELFDARDPASLDDSAAGLHVAVDSAPADDDAARREVGALDGFLQLFKRRRGVVY